MEAREHLKLIYGGRRAPRVKRADWVLGLTFFGIVFAAVMIFARPEILSSISRHATDLQKLVSVELPRFGESGSALGAVRVIDGDTLEVSATGERIRIANIDTPETGVRAKCTAERQLGERATREARALISEATNVQSRKTGRTDKYGRTVAFVEVNGRDLGKQLIEIGVARPWMGRRQPWCDARGELRN